MPYLRCPKEGCANSLRHISVTPDWYATYAKRLQANSDGTYSFPCPDCFRKMSEDEKNEWDLSEGPD